MIITLALCKYTKERKSIYIIQHVVACKKGTSLDVYQISLILLFIKIITEANISEMPLTLLQISQRLLMNDYYWRLTYC
ncbi:hypothetical protein V1478_000311 [Vespula squamosa]|uniref:Uncharacterized protein n=1 Tax=Vespula squamosa TaxID=30214 RepID=A0ABD2C5P6_VESSQ